MKFGIYIDAANINMNGGYAMRYDILKRFASHNQVPIRLNTYVSFDQQRAEKDTEYNDRQMRYYSILRNFGYKVITKIVKWYTDDEGNRYGKANADLDMAVDMLLQSKTLDKVYLLSGDGDFRRVVQAMQNFGTRVEVIAFENISTDLKFEADQFTSGYIVPNLLPITENKKVIENNDWGHPEHIVRGQCVNIGKDYGFLRYMDQDYQNHQAFFHFTELPKNNKPRLDSIYQFTLKDTKKGRVATKMMEI